MKDFNIVVIGGGPAGVIGAITAKQANKDKSVCLIRKDAISVIPCGIPYIFNSLNSVEENIMPDGGLDANGIEKIIAEATSIDRSEKTVSTATGEKIRYEKLIIAAGSDPFVPPIPGADKGNVFTIQKNFEYLKSMRPALIDSKDIVIIGGGFIGVEFAEELAKLKKHNITIVEMLPNLLGTAFDSDFCTLAEDKLKEMGVNISTGSKVTEILGDSKVTAVKLDNGKELRSDAVILSAGSKANTKLAEDAGLELGRSKGIWVDEHLQTSDPDIFAAGDCAEKRCFFTRKHIPIMLASTATAEARIAGSNLYKLQVIRENKGTIAIFSTWVNGLAMGSASMTESSARKQNFDIVVGNSNAVDHHPGKLPGTSKVKIRLVFSKYSGILLGGQVAGGISAGEMINIIGLAIQKRVSFAELETLQMATQPWLTAAPTIYPIVTAAQDASSKMR